MEEISTNHWTPKFDTFPTESRLLHKEIADQLFDIHYAHQRSVGNADFYRPTSVGNPVLWCSDSDDIVTRALEMGVDPSSFSLEHVDCMIELEIARHNLARKQHVIEEMVVTLDQVLLLGFGKKRRGRRWIHDTSQTYL
jgi:hypothetical protein